MNVSWHNLRSLLAKQRNIILCLNSYRNQYSTMYPKDAAKRIVWFDLEMTGLDIEKDHILEIACLITDKDLNIIARGPDIVIKQPDSILNNMHPWSISQHAIQLSTSRVYFDQTLLYDFGLPVDMSNISVVKRVHLIRAYSIVSAQSGLTEASRKSKISLMEAEKYVLDFVKTYVPEKKCPISGNSVYMDRLFLRKYMPTLNDYLHYRIIDISTIKELARRWFQKEYSNIPQKKFTHRSMDDILESIAELKYYKEHIFKL